MARYNYGTFFDKETNDWKLTVYSLSMMCPFMKTIATSLSKSRADALACILNEYNVPREEVAGIINMLNSVSMKE